MPDFVFDTAVIGNPNLGHVDYPGFYDNFNFDDGPLDYTEDGKAWIFQRSGSGDTVEWVRANGAAKLISGHLRSSAVVASGSSDGSLTTKIRSVGASRVGGQTIRAVDGSNYWRVAWRVTSGTNYYQLATLVAGTVNQIAVASPTTASADGDEVTTIYEGGQIEVKINGSTRIAVTGQTAFLTAQNHGLYGSNSDYTGTTESISFVPV